MASHRPDVAPLEAQAIALARQGNLRDAIALWQQLTQIDPQGAATWNNLAIAHYKLGSYGDAIAAGQRAVALDPHHAGYRVNLGAALKKLDELELAVQHYRQALTLERDRPDARRNLANALEKLGEVIEAETLLRGLLETDPTNAELHHAIGNVLWEQGRYEDAIVCYRTALTHRPHFPEVRTNLGMVLLTLGDWRRGLPEYEQRWQCVEIVGSMQRPRQGQMDPGQPSPLSTKGWEMQPYPQPMWDGQRAIAGHTLLLYADMGLGDAINFVRYVPQLADRGARILLDCPAPLERIFATVSGIDRIIRRQDSPPPFDEWCPLMTLPAALGTTPATIPWTGPYLQAPSSPDPLPPPHRDRDRRIGLVWASGKSASRRKRSCPLEQLLRLSKLSNVTLYSLQKDPTPQETQALGAAGAIDLNPRLGDLMDTASAIAQLDLVVTVDTAVAHLAGALGKPVWILLPHVPDWRWLLGRDRTNWYPTARLWRQPHLGAWDRVITQVIDSLRP
jgi:Flp pilus assembly protein TadD